MPITLEEIVEYEERLRLEIAERQCLLNAYETLRGHIARNGSAGPMPPAQTLTPAGLIPLAAPGQAPGTPAAGAAAPPTILSPAPPKNEELDSLQRGWGGNTAAVKWAIARMTNDYSLRDIQALLAREGCPLKGAEISVALTRLKSRGEIEQFEPGMGPNPAIFRKPETAMARS